MNSRPPPKQQTETRLPPPPPFPRPAQTAKKKRTSPKEQKKQHPKSSNNKKDQTTKKRNTLTGALSWFFAFRNSLQKGCLVLGLGVGAWGLGEPEPSFFCLKRQQGSANCRECRDAFGGALAIAPKLPTVIDGSGPAAEILATFHRFWTLVSSLHIKSANNPTDRACQRVSGVLTQEFIP